MLDQGNVNCLPSKNEIWSAKVADLGHHATRFGIALGAASDMAAVRKRKREMVEALIAMHLDRYKTTGAELVMGEAKFTGSKTLDVRLNDGGTRTLTGERIFLNPWNSRVNSIGARSGRVRALNEY